MKMTEEFPSKYIKSSDLDGREVRLTMANVEREEVGKKDGKPDMKPVVYFKGKEKGWVLNKTNATVLSDAYGDDSDDWYDQQIILFAIKTDFQGKVVDGIRCRVPTAKDNKKPKSDSISTAPERGDFPGDRPLDDDIPEFAPR